MEKRLMPRLFIYSTSTVWGIGANYFDDNSNLQIKKIKGNDRSKPLSLMFDNWNDLDKLLLIKKTNLLKKILSFETTILIQTSLINLKCSAAIIGNSHFVGFRIQPYKQSLQSISLFSGLENLILTTTSLNIQGEVPITSYKQAILFNEKFCDNQALVCQFHKSKMSKMPSTILKYEAKSNKFITIRKGQDFCKIQQEIDNADF